MKSKRNGPDESRSALAIIDELRAIVEKSEAAPTDAEIDAWKAGAMGAPYPGGGFWIRADEIVEAVRLMRRAKSAESAVQEGEAIVENDRHIAVNWLRAVLVDSARGRSPDPDQIGYAVDAILRAARGGGA